MTKPRRLTGKTLLLALLGAHVVLGMLRLPGKVWARRLDEIATYQQKGPAGFFLDTAHQHGAEVVEWLLANTPPDAVVLWRGESKGALEFVPSLIAPRLLVREQSASHGSARYLDRPLARLATANGELGPVLVVVGRGNTIAMEAR